MKTKLSLWILVSLLLLASAATPVLAGEMTVDQVVAKHIETIGGKDALQAVKSARISANFNMQGMALPLTMTFKRPLMLRVETEFQGMKMVQAYDGEKGWAIMPMMGSSEPEYMADDQLKQIQDQSDFDGILVDYEEKGHTVELVGREEVEGTDAYHLKVTKKNGDVIDMFLDTEYCLIFQQKGRTNMQGMEVNTTTNISDYKPVGDIVLPHSMETTVEGAPMTISMTFSNIELNVDVDDSIFAFPAKPESSEEENKDGEGSGE